MPDRLKEAVFSILGSHYATPGALPPLQVADLFAGSGAMGLEALSRGAASCVFVERDRSALTVLRGNLHALGAQGEARVVTADAWSYLFAAKAELPELIFLDPPYRDTTDASAAGKVGTWLQRLFGLAREGLVIVYHHPADVACPAMDEAPWRLLLTRPFGTGCVTFLQR